MSRCLYCYLLLTENEKDFHAACSKKMFGQPVPPELPYREDEMEALATEIVRTQTTVTGVQPKLSLHLTPGENKDDPKRLTIVGLWGGFILKPPSDKYAQLPEVEDLTMHLASLTGINVVPHSLIRLYSGHLAYITKRVDRVKKSKLHMEDMCQLTERLTQDKYYGSYEQIAKAIRKYSANPGLDLVNFCEQVLFSFLIGNADMHLKNFSLLKRPELGYILSPAYDMVATTLVITDDPDEMALTLNGRKRKIERSDFIAVFEGQKLDARQQLNIFKKMEKAQSEWMKYIDFSFLSNDFKASFMNLIRDRFARIK